MPYACPHSFPLTHFDWSRARKFYPRRKSLIKTLTIYWVLSIWQTINPVRRGYCFIEFSQEPYEKNIITIFMLLIWKPRPNSNFRMDTTVVLTLGSRHFTLCHMEHLLMFYSHLWYCISAMTLRLVCPSTIGCQQPFWDTFQCAQLFWEENISMETLRSSFWGRNNGVIQC